MLVVTSDDVPRALEVFEADWRSVMDADQLEAANKAQEVVLDPDAAETTCPACLTTFSTGPKDCPECGLGLF